MKGDFRLIREAIALRANWPNLILLILLIFMGGYSLRLFSDRRDPIQGGIMIIEALNSPIMEGTDLVVRSHRVKTRDDCPVASIRKATNITTGRVYPLDSQIWAGGPAGDDHLDLLFRTSHLPPGFYTGEAMLAYACPHHNQTLTISFAFSVMRDLPMRPMGSLQP